MNRLAFGDFAVTIKALPNVVRGSEVQIIGMRVEGGKVHYEAVLYKSSGEFQNFIGPLPESMFSLTREPSPHEMRELLALVKYGGPKTLGADGKRHGWSCVCDDCTSL